MCLATVYKESDDLEIFKKVTGEELSDAMAKYFFKHDGLIRLVIRDDD